MLLRNSFTALGRVHFSPTCFFFFLLFSVTYEPTNTIARSGHGAPAGRDRGTLSEETVSTQAASLVASEISWSTAQAISMMVIFIFSAAG